MFSLVLPIGYIIFSFVIFLFLINSARAFLFNGLSLSFTLIVFTITALIFAIVPLVFANSFVHRFSFIRYKRFAIVCIGISSVLYFLLTYVQLNRSDGPFRGEGQVYRTNGGSMLPGFPDKEIIYFFMLMPYDSPKLGDIVVFKPPETEKKEKQFIKRVIGVPGDAIALKGGYVYINGNKIEEPYLLKTGVTWGVVYGDGFMKNDMTVTVPQGHFFVLGDNRENSTDSRVFGFIPRNEIIDYLPSQFINIDWYRNRFF